VVDTATGAVAQRIDYDSYGRVLTDTNPGFQPFGFAGGLTDRDTGLVHFGLRDYDPQTGRWLSPDPVGFSGGDANLYGYVGGNPVDLVDPVGDFLGLPNPLSPIKTAVNAGINAAKDVWHNYGGCIAKAVSLTTHVLELVPGPIGMAASAAEQVYNCASHGIGGDGCTAMDLASTAMGFIPGERLAGAAGKAVRSGTFKTMKRSMPGYLGRAKDAYAYGQFTEMRTKQIWDGANNANTALGAFNTGYEAGGYASDINGYYS
jgi:RHS repeat-associated protein